ncbi:hypothetical protein B0H17DRAFT_1140925 [Mycena rosella]|uniref:Uncharacterized protein n=1 Tax=Mycena rosella TaxID=1033263 RepID=A0AAD7D0V1_MYCRO|nr:hypothetical protein B0H17DRAFT_1140925 [Mycena rosella]
MTTLETTQNAAEPVSTTHTEFHLMTNSNAGLSPAGVDLPVSDVLVLLGPLWDTEAPFDNHGVRALDSTPINGSSEFPVLELDINPDKLSTEQIAQLNAIRGHLGTLASRLTAMTAIVAEHQAAMADMQDSIQALRTEVVSRVDSMRNEIPGLRALKSRKELLTMSRNGGIHRVDAQPLANWTPLCGAPTNIPTDLRAMVDTTIPLRPATENQDEFDRRADAVLRTKEQSHAAFLLPPITRCLEGHRSEDNHIKAHLQLRNIQGGSIRRPGEPITSLRKTIASKVGRQIDFPNNVRPPKVSDTVKYQGQGGPRLVCMDFLEKLLGWMRAGNYSGDDLDWYRVVLLQSYLTGDAHRWDVTETSQYALKNNGKSPLLTLVISAKGHLHVDNVQWDAMLGPEKLYSDLKEKGQ